ncbi:hypothetical protein NQ317_016996 [Molorchus minor]|uniref:Uncharacterized protein n=1 Tax=Molorchus minor TaxID=1323400 RepID=A0ABQ9JMJ7_9CUCU|nr:hypothetical protein NQ317_016996 [Molorchus minor]
MKQFEAVQGKSRKKKQRRKHERFWLRRKRASSFSNSSETRSDSESEVSRSSYERDPYHSEQVLKMIGEQGPLSEAIGEAIHENVARVWSTLLQNGMETEVVKSLLLKYPPVANCRLVEAPKLNMESHYTTTFRER